MGRSPTGWTGGHFTVAALLVNTKAIAGSFAPLAGIGSHVTAIRIVGNLTTDHTASAAGGAAVIGAAVFADAAVAAGVASLPDPLTDIEDDIWTFIRGVPYPAAATRRVAEFDSRAARKIEEGQQLVFILANSAAGASSTLQLYVRVLFQTAIRQ